MLIGEAIFPFLMPALLNLRLPSEHEGLSDLFYFGSKIGFLVQFDNSSKATIVDFYDENILAQAFAFDIARLSSAAFQSSSSLASDLKETSLVPWALIRAYYASFYSAHAIMRMVGQSCTYFESSHIARIVSVAEVSGAVPTFTLQRGVQHVTLLGSGSSFVFLKAGSSTAGSHEAFWRIFLNNLRDMRDRVIAGPLTPTENQKVYSSLTSLINVLHHDSWLSFVRNELQYRQGYQVWFPSSIAKRNRTLLSSVSEQWCADPLTVVIDLNADDLERFLSTAVFIIALCRALILFVGERSDAGPRCFTAASPAKFLRLGGFA